MDEVEELIRQLKDSDAKVRADAAWELGRRGDVRAVGPLIEKLGDEDHYVQQAAAEAFGKIGEHAVKPLIELLKKPNSAARAAWVLGKMEDPRAVPALIEALKDDDSDVRNNVARALGEIAPYAEDIDLDETRILLQAAVESVGTGKRIRVKQSAASVYAMIAEEVAKRKKTEMPGEMLPGRIPKPKKKGIYRMRRVANG